MTRRGDDAPIAASARFLAWRRARRRRLVRPTVALLVLTAVIAAGAWAVLGSSLFGLRSVTIDGIARVSRQQVLDRAALPAGRSLLRLDPDAIARRVEQLPAVAAATVTRQWPHGLLITVTERRPVAAVQVPTGWMLLDLHGVAFARVATPPPDLVPVQVDAPTTAAGADRTRAAMAVYRALPRPLRRQVAQLTAPSVQSVSFRLRDGREVEWGSPSDNARKVAVLQALLHRRAARYDVSAPGVAVTS